MGKSSHAPKAVNAITDERGFTLIELLVVILILGILAAVAIPSFLGQSAKGYDAAAKGAVRTAQTAVEAYNTEHGSYCSVTPAKLVAIEPALADAPSLSVNSCAGGDNSAYTIAVTSRSTNSTVYALSVSGGVSSRTCSTPGAGSCPSTGTW